MADFWDSLNAQVGGGFGSPAAGDMAQQITDLYHQAGRGDPTPQEIAAHSMNPGGLPAVAALLKSDNASAVAAAPVDASGTTFGQTYAPFAPQPVAAANFGQQNQNYSAPQFTEAAPTFTAPTGVTYLNDPGAQYRLDRTQSAVERAAASKGTVLNPGTVSAVAQRVGDQASAEFQGVFDRAGSTFDKNLATYGAKYNVFSGNADRTFRAESASNAAIGANNATAQQTVTNAQQRFNNDGTVYGVNYGVSDKAQSDYWQRLMDQARLGESAAAA